MADLPNNLRSMPVQIVGGGTTEEDYYGKVSPNKELQTSDIADTSGVYGAITVGVTAVEAKVGGSVLANRKSLTVFNQGTVTIYWGYSNAVTSSNGTPIYKEQFISWAIGPNISVWLISGTAGQDVRVTENA